jgi:hypothetical protein
VTTIETLFSQLKIGKFTKTQTYQALNKRKKKAKTLTNQENKWMNIKNTWKPLGK